MSSTLMASCSSSYKRPRPIIDIFVPFLLFFFFLVVSTSASSTSSISNGTEKATAMLYSGEEMLRFQRSPDGDVIDCVPVHLQPAFEHPMLRGQKPQEAPAARPKSRSHGHGGDGDDDGEHGLRQAWWDAGEECPEGTIPVRRTTEADMLRASAAAAGGGIGRFGMKPRGSGGGAARRDSSSSGHEHAVGYVSGGGQFYGAKASLNVWPAQVASPAEFSLSQIWLISGSFGNYDLNTIEAGWQVSPQLYGDNHPRFFTYWTNDAYQETGCYNLHCSGFVQTNSRIAMGAAISPISSFAGRQFDITLLIWKDPKQGHWWLQLGSGPLVGYWPSFLFSHLGIHADMAQFGGEVVNTRPSGSHTPTQMGSGHFPSEGYGRAAYFRNIQLVDWDNNLISVAGLRLLADRPACYDIVGGQGGAWGTYFYYGGPGRNARCP
uniref:Neprosin PEP catalytic domain-containing protein n=1 Tax=Leersia perrieri TaxID=77586 RepID=A0A0D9WD99_9ORYZ